MLSRQQHHGPFYGLLRRVVKAAVQPGRRSVRAVQHHLGVQHGVRDSPGGVGGALNLVVESFNNIKSSNPYWLQFLSIIAMKQNKVSKAKRYYGHNFLT